MGPGGVVGPEGLLVTVLVAGPGDHGGISGLVGPFEEGAVAVPWRGRAPHAAGAQVVDGVREVVLAVEHPDGRLVLLSVSGPEEAFASGELDESLVTVRVEP